MPWKNGGGVTRELARVPSAGEFDWRLSVADVATDGPFSAFEGIDRILVLLSGAGMDLHFVDDRHVERLRPVRDVKSFPGEASVHATLVDGPTTDLNLMWRRERWDAGVLEAVLPVDLEVDGAHKVVFVVEGSATLPDGRTVVAGDAIETGDRTDLVGSGVVLVFSLWPR